MGKKSKTGNAGPKVRSDCEVVLELKRSGGITIDLRSRVKALYGESVEQQCREVLKYYGIKNADLTIDDSGALPFVIDARLEAAVRNLTGTRMEFLRKIVSRNFYSTEKERFRFTRLYLPGNTPGLMINAGLHSADGIILDLEDSVAPEKKDEARVLVRNALLTLDFYGAERMVRINQGERGLEDLQYIIPHNVNLVLLPKCENPHEVIEVDKAIFLILKRSGIRTPVWLMPIIESALGVENSFDIARSTENVAAIAIGLEDYTADLGVRRTLEGVESIYARTRIVNAAKAARVQPIDSVFSDVADMEGLEKTAIDSRSLGFEGMGCIHPRQTAIIQKCFSPDYDEIERAKKIVTAFSEAGSRGLGVVSLGTKMIDPPVVSRALKTIKLAVKLKLLNKNWNSELSAD